MQKAAGYNLNRQAAFWQGEDEAKAARQGSKQRLPPLSAVGLCRM
jgi:hypothetical protein